MTYTELSRSQLAEGGKPGATTPQGVLTAPRAEGWEWLSIHAKGEASGAAEGPTPPNLPLSEQSLLCHL